MNKIVAAVMIVILTLMPFQTVFADSGFDVTPPVINKMIIHNSEGISAYGNMDITFDITEEGCGVKIIRISFRNENTNQYVYLNYDVENENESRMFTGIHKISFDLQEQNAYFQEGEYEVNSVVIYDSNENRNYYAVSKDEITEATKRIKIQDSFVMDTKGPVFQGVTINNSQGISYGEDIDGTIDIEEDTGLDSFELQYENEEGEEIVIYGIDNEGLTTGKHGVKFYLPMKQNCSPGEYTLRSIKSEDILGNIYFMEDENWDTNKFTVKIQINDCTQTLNNQVSLNSVRIMENNIVTPNVLTLNAEWNPGKEGISGISLSIANENGNKKALYWEPDQPITDSKAEIEIPLNTYLENGTYHIEQIIIYGGNVKVKYTGKRLESILADDYKIQIRSRFDIVYYGSTANTSGVIKAIHNMKDGEVAIVEYSLKSIAEKEIFEAMAQRNVTVVFEGEDVQWVFHGSDIKKEKCKSIDLSVGIYITKGKKLGYSDDENVLAMKFADNGELPGKVKIRVGNEYLKAKYGYKSNLVLSYYNKTPEIINRNISCATDGYAEMEITHNSTYILSDHVPRLVAPADFKVSSSDPGKVILSWGRVYGAAGYKIYRSTKKNGSFKQLKVIDDNSAGRISFYDCTVKVGRTYYYRVCAYGKNVNSVFSGEKSITVLPGKAAVSVKKKSKKKVKISIKVSGGINNFEVYVSFNGKKYKKAKVLKNRKNCVINMGRKKILYVKARAYTKYKGKKYYGKYSDVKAIKR